MSGKGSVFLWNVLPLLEIRFLKRHIWFGVKKFSSPVDNCFFSLYNNNII